MPALKITLPSGERLWVGRETNHHLVVHSPANHTVDFGMIRIFSVAQDAERLVDSAWLKGASTDDLTENEALAAIVLYKQFSLRQLELARTKSDRLQEEDRQREAVLEEKRKQTIDRHRARITDMGREYRGAIIEKGKVIRNAHCWSCKSQLSNASDVECASCGWIVCSCGACGCGKPF